MELNKRFVPRTKQQLYRERAQLLFRWPRLVYTWWKARGSAPPTAASTPTHAAAPPAPAQTGREPSPSSGPVVSSAAAPSIENSSPSHRPTARSTKLQCQGLSGSLRPLLHFPAVLALPSPPLRTAAPRPGPSFSLPQPICARVRPVGARSIDIPASAAPHHLPGWRPSAGAAQFPRLAVPNHAAMVKTLASVTTHALRRLAR